MKAAISIYTKPRKGCRDDVVIFIREVTILEDGREAVLAEPYYGGHHIDDDINEGAWLADLPEKDMLYFESSIPAWSRAYEMEVPLINGNLRETERIIQARGFSLVANEQQRRDVFQYYLEETKKEIITQVDAKEVNQSYIDHLSELMRSFDNLIFLSIC